MRKSSALDLEVIKVVVLDIGVEVGLVSREENRISGRSAANAQKLHPFGERHACLDAGPRGGQSVP